MYKAMYLCLLSKSYKTGAVESVLKFLTSKYTSSFFLKEKFKLVHCSLFRPKNLRENSQPSNYSWHHCLRHRSILLDELPDLESST